MANTTIQLTDLLQSTSYRLAYALPLVVLSTLLVFAGSFLTLDRTRSFQPRGDPLQVPGSFNLSTKPNRVRLHLQSGLGGIAVGYSFGLYLSTFLALVVPYERSSTPLGPKSFLAVWIFTAVPFAIFSGLFKYAALALMGITGGTSLALALSVAIHPNLLARRVFLALLVPVCCILTVLPVVRTQRSSIRLAAAATGAFGLTLSIALFAHVPSWSNVWERLWVANGNGWGVGTERGLSAGYWLILIIGYFTDWALKRYCGANPDEEWDTYLTEYASSLPNTRDRAGIFRPLSYSFWDRLLPWMHRPKPSSPSDYPFPVDMKHSASPRLSFDYTLQGTPSVDRPLMPKTFTSDASSRPLRQQSQEPLARLRGSRNTKGQGYRKREAVKFGAMNPDSSSSEDEDDPLSVPPPPPLARRTSTRSSVTLTNGSSAGSQYVSLAKGDLGIAAAAKRTALQSNNDGALEYSDYEEDVTNTRTRSREHRDSQGWRPQVVASHDLNAAGSATLVGKVPMTPSLIRAVDRITAAQTQAYRPTDPTTARDLADGASEQRWGAFWQDVATKVAEGTNAR